MNAQSETVAAYREGLGLAAVAVMCGGDGIRISAPGRADEGAPDAAETVEARWWCRRAMEAETVAAAAERLRRRKARESDAPPSASEFVINAARRLTIELHSDDEVAAAAMTAAARIDGEIAAMQQRGELKSVNKAYRQFRLAACARGESAPSYRDWLRKYRDDLVRTFAATLRAL